MGQIVQLPRGATVSFSLSGPLDKGCNDNQESVSCIKLRNLGTNMVSEREERECFTQY